MVGEGSPARTIPARGSEAEIPRVGWGRARRGRSSAGGRGRRRGGGRAEDPIERCGALFERDGDRYIPTPLTRGPWDPRAMHGGAPSALFTHVCEQHDPGPADFVARVTVELM